MATSETPVSNPLTQHHFLLRRLHSLTGVIPIGAFMINHLLTNAQALWPNKFDHHVMWIHEMPFLLAIEIIFIFAPLAFHAIYGIVIAVQGQSNAATYPYMDNWRYSLQRITAYITLAFILLHLGHFRFAHWLNGPKYSDAVVHDETNAIFDYGYFFDMTRDGFSNYTTLWVIIYVVGVLAATYHLCNGLVTFCITWGITVGDQSRRYVSVGAAALGVLLVSWGFASIYALVRPLEEPQGAAEDAYRDRELHEKYRVDEAAALEPQGDGAVAAQSGDARPFGE